MDSSFLASPEGQFLAWAVARPELEPMLERLPREVFSEAGRTAVAHILAHTWPQNGGPPPDGPALGFLRDQLLALVGREASKAQRTGSVDRLRWMMHLLDDALTVTTAPPLEAYDEIVPAPRAVISTGVGPIDEQIQGLAVGELGILALPPGRGKTTLLINFAVASLMEGRTVQYLTVADQGRDELVMRVDTCVLGVPCPLRPEAEMLRQRHADAVEAITGTLMVSDFTAQECTLADVERVIRACQSDLVIVDHADDVLSPYSNDPTVTRHSLRVVYLALKKLAVKYQVPIWTASQTHEISWHMESTGISELAEAKTGKATGAAIVLAFSGGRRPLLGVMSCTIAKARRHYTDRTFSLRYDFPRMRVW